MPIIITRVKIPVVTKRTHRTGANGDCTAGLLRSTGCGGLGQREQDVKSRRP
jgi:hypothetical protein